MQLEGCELYAEIRYGEELSFEEVGHVEALLREELAGVLVALAPSYLDVRLKGDELAFLTSLPPCHTDDLREVCRQLGEMMGQGSQGRLVVAGHGFGPVLVWRFTSLGLEENTVEPGGQEGNYER